MAAKPFDSVLVLWSAAYLGPAFLLTAGLLPQGTVSSGLLAQLCWLALLASIPTSLALAAASRLAGAARPIVATWTLILAILTMAVGWEHVDFLLSGPAWIGHPHRFVLRVATLLLLGLLSGAGWLWLILGIRIRKRPWQAIWIALCIVAVSLLTAVIVRYRAYDYSIAQLVFPAALLSSAMLYLIVRDSPRRFIGVGLAATCALLGVGSRFAPALVATGQREVIAQSRAGALATLYVLPRVSTHSSLWSDDARCPEPRPVVETSPIGILADGRRNVILITVDALRKDVVGLEHDGSAVTAHLSRWSEKGLSWGNATSTYPATLFAVGSAFTGLSPAELYLSPSLPETIFTRSRAHVDRQIAVLPDVKWFRLPIVQQFLAHGVETKFAATDEDATDALIAQLRQAHRDDASVMAWVHYYAPHDPYESHAAFPFGRGRKNAYLSEVAYFDRELGRLMSYLEAEHWLDDSLVIFFSDHGEALGERSYWGHHVYLNGWMVDVPLVLWHSAFTPAEPRVGASLADVAPTVLHFLGLPLPSDTSARSLFTLEPDLRGRATFSEAFPVRGRELFDSFRLPALDDATIRARLQSIRVSNKGYEPKGAISLDGDRLIHHRSAGTTLFFDDEANPDEDPGLQSDRPEAREALGRELQRWEHAQMRRIECRLQLSEERTETPRPR
ncbi:MAG: sulfatase-like hydrolase/transferase [Deltaproteobacteria bacterium]|nr:sulfatase-like hydrolase/transferase [Deltaproteobacteria bacterium]NND28695.1 sulfatase-like hydrolase/transferase [Myxococcales bacterium]MBT8466467.1 sulfatase-like hydrolase/transferase [Deltaproteobacteria bacterium]MBT8481841.1 sulfatase-like hydrolase/transferase [Deltaproteobacteria bacterium]NNK06523.1 sulfatase-like hydrolase/transferase [Myxococcales bacterium]